MQKVTFPHVNCKPTITTAIGYAASKICSGALIFEENFDKLDKHKWRPQVTLSTHGANGDFQLYVAGDKNSFATDGHLNIKPTLTAQKIGYDKVENGSIHLNDCTDANKSNCERKTDGNSIINPIRSARLHTKSSFAFKYGRVEVIAKMPIGDWLWPAIWLLPLQWKYGKGRRSGEIDLVQSRGNVDYIDSNGNQIGVKRVTSTLHFGPKSNMDGWPSSTYSRKNPDGFNHVFHRYECLWNDKGIKFFVDNIEIGYTAAGNGGFWEIGQFHGDNIWANGTKMAPFDEEVNI
ncbi:beta-1,3-glucan-binding protein-like isoform X3 [Contarinia nasturtii]|uniref:beta-1,3-glucan-binding protein-like isoform X3 n=1 Tax=Contarinia nasturtii TaxID=265458 RepID=UPI0012D3935E|nr:beta-1,3-glucan-binding protein-like isoform X3 [Contarinia nasturtii]